MQRQDLLGHHASNALTFYRALEAVATGACDDLPGGIAERGREAAG